MDGGNQVLREEYRIKKRGSEGKKKGKGKQNGLRSNKVSTTLQYQVCQKWGVGDLDVYCSMCSRVSASLLAVGSLWRTGKKIGNYRLTS